VISSAIFQPQHLPTNKLKASKMLGMVDATARFNIAFLLPWCQHI
jgi:hypothetical protein